MNTETIMQALELMGQGMLGIFVVLGLIALLVALMQKIDNRK
jgi:Na+-transporting methylmalonyl-CoA/oxaloacetate decarboxylase gamma subunit